jgi:hypothetical protein
VVLRFELFFREFDVLLLPLRRTAAPIENLESATCAPTMNAIHCLLQSDQSARQFACL